MEPFIHLLSSILLIGLFLYIKLMPYKARLYAQYTGVFTMLEKIFSTLLTALRTVFKPVAVGQNLSLDTAQLFLYIILLALLQL